MYNFNFDMPARVLFGEGKLSELHEQKLPGKKALIVTSMVRPSRSTDIWMM